ncbi:PAS domain-containing sensor histidine kinase, partial [bacterium]|nr:PAS domain-containing sensor histidine kinase [bacterium]
PDQMTQVFLNLFRNAASAMVDGGVLGISTKLAGGFVWIDVADSGPGIPSELRKKIFEPFFTTKSSGTGLGLSISYQILEAHNGMIWFTSPPTGGTIFHLKFPVKTNR